MRRSFGLGLFAVILVAAGSVLLALVIRANEVDHFHDLQRDAALRSARQAEVVAELSVGELATAAAFFQAEGEGLTHREFDVVGASLLRRGALTATAYVQRVPAAERARFEATHGFSIIERPTLGKPQRATGRPVYYPVAYVVAQHPGQAPLGYDIGSDPARGPALRRAGETGKPVATPVMPLLLGGSGINVYRPFYRDGAPTRTPAERRAALLGFAAGAFRVNDLAAAAIDAVPESVDVQIRAAGDTVVGSGALDDAARAPIAIADQTWTLVVRDPDRPSVGLPLLVAGIGVALAALLGALVLVWSRNERMRKLQREASQDPLTGLKNRRRFEEDLRSELARSRREGAPGALLMLDLDNFKQVNDTLGHPIGDRVIEEIAGVLGHRTRETDVLARVGGDEFAIVLPHCDAAEARIVAETITTAIREHIPRTEDAPPITASVGVAMFGPGTEATFETVLTDADAAMYEAKDAGRDGVRLA